MQRAGNPGACLGLSPTAHWQGPLPRLRAWLGLSKELWVTIQGTPQQVPCALSTCLLSPDYVPSTLLGTRSTKTLDMVPALRNSSLLGLTGHQENRTYSVVPRLRVLMESRGGAQPGSWSWLSAMVFSIPFLAL